MQPEGGDEPNNDEPWSARSVASLDEPPAIASPKRMKRAAPAPRQSSGRAAARAAVSACVSAANREEEEDSGDDGGARAKRRRSVGAGPGSARSGPADGQPTATPEQRILEGEAPLERASIVLECLAEQDAEGWFARPVTEEDVPGYSTIIDTPMDFASIRAKLADGSYGSEAAEAVASDIRLVFRNAVT